MDAIYNRICADYGTTRKADPEITRALLELLEPRDGGHYLDIACGTGNYTIAMAAAGDKTVENQANRNSRYWYGFDQSANMLTQARAKSSQVEWSLYDVTQTQYPNQTFDGATCILAVHHFPDLMAAFAETRRILKPAASFVIFTSTADQMEHYWLNNYFPTLMKKSSAQMPSLAALRAALEQNRFSVERCKEFFITPQLEDFFLYSGKQRPEIYLSGAVRSGISSFANFGTTDELESGLQQLAADITSGAINARIIEATRHSDYLFLQARAI